MRARLILAVLIVLLLGAAGAILLSEDESDPGQDRLASRAALITDLYVNQEWEAVRTDFDETMSEQLTVAKLAETWDFLTAESGDYLRRGEPKIVAEVDGVTVVDTPMFFERNEYKSRFGFDEDGQVAGFFVLLVPRLELGGAPDLPPIT